MLNDVDLFLLANAMSAEIRLLLQAGVAALSLGEDKASCSCLEGRFDVMASACFNYVLCHLPGRHRLLTRLP